MDPESDAVGHGLFALYALVTWAVTVGLLWSA